MDKYNLTRPLIILTQLRQCLTEKRGLTSFWQGNRVEKYFLKYFSTWSLFQAVFFLFSLVILFYTTL